VQSLLVVCLETFLYGYAIGLSNRRIESHLPAMRQSYWRWDSR